MSKCKCNLRTRLVGEGCQYCNPTLHAELLEEKVADLEAELTRLRLTETEREAVESAMDIAEAVGNPYLRNALRALLARHGGDA